MTKKYIFNIFFIILYSINMAHAAPECKGSTSLMNGTCEKEAGCCVETGTATGDLPTFTRVCNACSVGLYNPGSGKQNCTQPEGAEWRDQVPGLTENICPWKITCYKDEYWYDGDANVANAGCRTCQSAGKQPHPDNRAETIEGYGSQISWLDFELKATDISIRCIENDYSIELDASSEGYGKKTLWIKPTIGFSNTKNATTWSAEPDPSWIIPNIPDNNWWNRPNGVNEYGFTGYGTLNGAKYFTGTGELADGIDVNSFYSEIQLIATWQNVYYNVVYYTEAGVQHARLDKININTLTLSSGDTAMPYADGPAIDGKLFIGWTCNVPTTCNTQSGQQNCTKTCDVATVELTDEMPRPSSGRYDTLYTRESVEENTPINLYPRYTDCPAGYYCVNNQANPCPGGTTTITTSTTINSSITNCFMSGNVTYLKDNFTGDNKQAIEDFIPDASNVKMYYQQ